ncbi:MAG: hypothetical protein MZV64_12015 [Ignavibacteriales bacterium]|nr:hypothetical protein [Ignavibacteriales bacterium]
MKIRRESVRARADGPASAASAGDSGRGGRRSFQSHQAPATRSSSPCPSAIAARGSREVVPATGDRL